MNLQKAVYVLLLLTGIVFVLIIGKSFIIPLLLAIISWFLVKEIRKIFKRIPVLGKKMPIWLLNLLSVLLLYSVLVFIVQLLIDNINHLSKNLALYEANLKALTLNLQESTNYDLVSIWNNFIGEFNFTGILERIFDSLYDLLGNTFMIGLYLLFILMEESLFGAKLKALYETKSRYEEMRVTLARVNSSVSNYISLKTLVSLITGVVSYIALTIIGIDSPLFWAFLIFILNFIPTIGSLIATLFPAVMALLQFGSWEEAFIVLGAVGSIQLIVGNIVEPKIMGNSLNISSFVVILALSFWGAIWGIVGMVLSVPITVILIILLGQFEQTRGIAILLSEKGDLSSKLK